MAVYSLYTSSSSSSCGVSIMGQVPLNLTYRQILLFGTLGAGSEGMGGYLIRVSFSPFSVFTCWSGYVVSLLYGWDGSVEWQV